MSVVHCPGIVFSCLGRESEWTSSLGNRTATRVTIRAAQNVESRQLAHWDAIFSGQSSKWSLVKFWLIARSTKCGMSYRRMTDLTEDDDETTFPVGHRKRFFWVDWSLSTIQGAGFASGRAWGSRNFFFQTCPGYYWKDDNAQFFTFTTKENPMYVFSSLLQISNPPQANQWLASSRLL